MRRILATAAVALALAGVLGTTVFVSACGERAPTPSPSALTAPPAPTTLASTPAPSPTPTATSIPSPAGESPTVAAPESTPSPLPCATPPEAAYIASLREDLSVYFEANTELADIGIFDSHSAGFTDEFKRAFDRPAGELREASRNILDRIPTDGRVASWIHPMATRMARGMMESVNVWADALDTGDADKLAEGSRLYDSVLPDLLALGWALDSFCEREEP